jgi:hypothetical protein
MTHTATPFSHQVAMSSDTQHESYIMANGKIIAFTAQEKDGLTFDETRANAAFIVKACNSHDALVSACKMAKSAILPHFDDDEDGSLEAEASTAIIAALTLAGESVV